MDAKLTWQCDMAELLAHVRAASRRTPPAKQPPTIRTDDFTAYLRVHMAWIRRKLEPQPTQPRYFITAPGVGYRFESEQEAGVQ
jgi:DNA-binding response OmpR family regulator